MKKLIVIMCIFAFAFLSIASATDYDELKQITMSYYPLNESTGTTDFVSGYNALETATGNVSNCRTGNSTTSDLSCYHFNSGNHVYFGNRFSSNATGSVSFWYLINSTGINDGNWVWSLTDGASALGDPSYLIMYYDGAATKNKNFGIRNTAQDEILYFGNSNLTTANTWYHVVWTSGTDGNALYINGNLANGSYSFGSNTTQAWFKNVTSASNFTLGGARLGNINYNNFRGRLDEFTVYNNTLKLTAAQAALLYNNGSGCSYPYNCAPTQAPIQFVTANILSPSNNTQSNHKLNVTYNVSGSDATINCSIYINDTANQTTTGITNATESFFYINDMNTDSTYAYFLACAVNGSTIQTATNNYIYTRTINPQLELPLNATHMNEPLNVFFNVTGNAETYSCDLYVNSVLNKTNSNVANATTTNLTVTDMVDDGIYTYYVGCTQNGKTLYSSLKTYVFDSSQPLINLVSPLYDNSTIYTGYTATIIGNTTDDYLFRVNISIYNSTGTLMYSNYSGDLTSVTLYDLSRSFNTTLWANGAYRLYLETADSHTAKEFKEVLLSEEKQKDKEYDLKLSKDTVNFKLGKDMGIKFVKDFDRIKFELDAKGKLEKKQLKIQPTEKMVKIENSAYKCHYVFGDYWFDCEGLENPAESFDKATNTLTIDFDMSTDKVTTDSLGGLNENEADITFNIQNCVPNWQCDGYAACGINDSSACDSVTDTAVCGLPYEGDYSEFAWGSCNYCTANLEIQFITDCDPTNRTKNVMYNYTNYGECCAATGLETDCNLSQISEFSFGDYAYYYFDIPCNLWTYGTEDMPLALVDGTTKLVITFGLFAGLIGMLYVGVFVAKKLNWKKWW